MKTKILIITAAAFLLVSQAASAQLRAGIGYALGTQSLKNEGPVTKTNLNGFQIGASYNIDLLEGNWGVFGIEPGIAYDFLTDSEKTSQSEIVTVKSATTEHYLDIPVNAKYGYDFIPGTIGAYVFAGPVFSFGLASQVKTATATTIGDATTTITTVLHKYSGKFTSKDLDNAALDELNKNASSNYGWFDVKIGIGAGVKLFETLDVRFGYNFGLVNRYTGEADGWKNKSGLFYVGVAYLF